MSSSPVSRDRSTHDSLQNAVARDLARSLSEPLSPGLYLVATPIGNLTDVTLRALSVLARADIVYCEDTRHSARLFSHFGLSPMTRPLHDHNEDGETPRILAALAEGRRVAVISDAGTPLISDPGFRLVRAAANAGCDVFAVPGASAVITAMAVSGLPTDAFLFAGFLAPKTAARRKRLTELRDIPATLVFFEAPQRVAAALTDLAEVLGGRQAMVARELTKLHEELARGTLCDLAQAFSTRETKGEFVIVVAQGEETVADDHDIEGRLRAALLDGATVKDAAKQVAEQLSVPRSRVYGLALGLKDQIP